MGHERFSRDHADFTPPGLGRKERNGQSFIAEPRPDRAAGTRVTIRLVFRLAHPLEPGGVAEGVTVVAARGDTVAAGRGIPRLICPLDAGHGRLRPGVSRISWATVPADPGSGGCHARPSSRSRTIGSTFARHSAEHALAVISSRADSPSSAGVPTLTCIQP